MARQWTQDLITVSLCIQIVIGKMQLCSLSVAYADSYHNPTATTGHSAHNIDISKPLTHTTASTWSAVVRPVRRTAKFSKTMLEAAYGGEINIKLSGNSSAVSMPIASIVLCDTTAHFKVDFYCPQHKVHLCNYNAVIIISFLIIHPLDKCGLSWLRRDAH